MDAREIEVRGDLGECDRAHATRRVATDLGGRQLRVPQRHDAERQEPAAALAAPLLHHPVVVRVDAQLGELSVFAPEKDLAREARVVREAELRLDAVDVHVGETVGNLPAAGADLVVGGGGERDLLGLEARCRDVALQRGHRALVVPPHHVGALGTGSFDVTRTLQHDGAGRVVLDVWSRLAELRRETRRPDVGRLDEVGVDVDDRRDLRDQLRRDVGRNAGMGQLHHGRIPPGRHGKTNGCRKPTLPGPIQRGRSGPALRSAAARSPRSRTSTRSSWSQPAITRSS